MKKNKLKILRGEKGAAAIEFAIVLPVLLLILIGIIEFGLLFYNQQVLTNASREGARAGIMWEEPATIIQIATEYCQDHLLTFGEVNIPVVGVDPAAGGAEFQDDLTVTVSYEYDFLAPSVLGLGVNKTLAARTVMRMEMD